MAAHVEGRDRPHAAGARRGRFRRRRHVEPQDSGAIHERPQRHLSAHPLCRRMWPGSRSTDVCWMMIFTTAAPGRSDSNASCRSPSARTGGQRSPPAAQGAHLSGRARLGGDERRGPNRQGSRGGSASGVRGCAQSVQALRRAASSSIGKHAGPAIAIRTLALQMISRGKHRPLAGNRRRCRTG